MSTTPHPDTRTLAIECRELIETLYGQALAAGDDILSERCSATMETLDDLGGLNEPLRIVAGGLYKARCGWRVRIGFTDYQHAAGSEIALGVVRDPRGSEFTELFLFDGRRYLGNSPHDFDIVDYWHDGLNAPAPALPEPVQQQAAE